MDNPTWFRAALAVIVVLFTVLGTLYAAFTPPWQVPDEPAHYNYVRALAQERLLPVIEAGDYDQAYLTQLTTDHFPPHMEVGRLEYEDHQPPLYYLLATPVFWLGGGRILPLRLFSVVMGAVQIAVAGMLALRVFGGRSIPALLAAGLIAFIPQHVAMLSGINNDALAELLLAAVLLALVGYLAGQDSRPARVGLGLLLGLTLLTKLTIYFAVLLVPVAVALRWRAERRSLGWALDQLAWIAIPACLLAVPWLARNALVYGWADPLAQGAHSAVVEGQPTTGAWIAQHGWGNYLTRLFQVTFQSFWGQFGWMELVLPARIYQALLVFSAVLAAGFGVWAVRGWRSRTRQGAAVQTQWGRMLACAVLLTGAQYVYYNLTFVQHQGRYLFPALIPLAAGAVVAIETLAEPRVGRSVALGMAGATGLLGAWGLLRGDLPGWLMLCTAGAAGAIAGVTWLPLPLRRYAGIVPILGLIGLDIYCLFGVIVPHLPRF